MCRPCAGCAAQAAAQGEQHQEVDQGCGVLEEGRDAGHRPRQQPEQPRQQATQGGARGAAAD
eukprot:1238003-Prymnesium_polylepis.1